MNEPSKKPDADNKDNETEGRLTQTEGRLTRLRRRISEWQLRKYVARGMAYGAGSGTVSLLLLWMQTRY